MEENMFERRGVLGGEEMYLTLDYAYYHTFFCLLQPLVLICFGRTRHFRIAHCFGLFGWLMDYGVMYLQHGTRTVSYPNYDGNMDKGMEPLGPVGNFVFFLWFDYGGFGVVLWALHFQDVVRGWLFKENVISEKAKAKAKAKKNKNMNKNATTPPSPPPITIPPFDYVELFALLIVPIQFWTAPWLSPSLNIDSRELVLARSSPKSTYVIMLFIFSFVLYYIGNVSVNHITSIVASGVGCSCIHHLALFSFGLRGYSDLRSLSMTLLTEWPALILGVACFSTIGGTLVSSLRLNIKGTTIFRVVMWACLIASMAPYLSKMEEEDSIAYLMPFVPGQHMQSIGTLYLRSRTCIAPKLLPVNMLPPKLDCWSKKNDGKVKGKEKGKGTDKENKNKNKNKNDGTDMLIMASAAKSGAVLSARIVAEVGSACGLCVASGERSRAGIPGPIEYLPSYNGRFLHAIINMRTWPTYVKDQGYVPSIPKENAHVRCVTFLRDPLSRLKSLYLYARSGGETWFRSTSGIMQRLNNQNDTLKESLEYFWNEFGREYLVQSHEYMYENLKVGCVGIKMEDLKTNFDMNIAKMLKVWGIQPSVIPKLVQNLANADLSRKTQEQRNADPHITSNKFSKQLVKNVVDLLNNMEEVQTMMRQHRIELGYQLLDE